MNSAATRFVELIEIIKKLRDPHTGCPWDIEQTHQSLKPYMIEEAYEAVDAIDSDPASLKEELGDVLLQVVLHSQIASESKQFDIEAVIQSLSSKLIERHPHVFGTSVAKDSAAVVAQWEDIKKKSKGTGALSGVPKSMPALLRSLRLGEKAARVGFDWQQAADVKGKIKEELEEFLKEPDASNTAAEELGDLLFSVAQYLRKIGSDPERILQAANEKFIRRFEQLEALAQKPLKEYSLEELEKLWTRVKKDQAST